MFARNTPSLHFGSELILSQPASGAGVLNCCLSTTEISCPKANHRVSEGTGQVPEESVVWKMLLPELSGTKPFRPHGETREARLIAAEH